MKSLLPAAIALAAITSAAITSAAIAPAHAAEIDGEAIPYSQWLHTLLPGETLTLALAPGETAEIDGKALSAPNGTAEWTAGAVGDHRLVVSGPGGQTRVSVFVMRPSSDIDERGYLGDFRMGFYPRNTPRGFIRLDKDDMDTPVSPSFAVGQFICKQQPGEWPKYLRVSDDNLVRLETLLASLREDGLTTADTMFVMSGFRSPFYNTAIGSAKFSRHMYGDAADVYIDFAPRDGVMDDINSDGQVTKADANFMYDYAQDLFADADVKKGGLGSYRANAVHGPFVHVDARGTTARWGR